MENTDKTPSHIWVVGGLTLLFNAMGIVSYMSTKLGMLEAAGMPADQIAYMSDFPTWVNATWALGVWGAFIGSILILFRSRHALTSFIIAFVGLVLTTYYQRAMSDLPDGMDGLGLPIAIWAVTLFLLWYTHKMKNEGLLK